MAESRDDGVVFVPEIFVVIELEANVPNELGRLKHMPGVLTRKVAANDTRILAIVPTAVWPTGSRSRTAKAAMSTGSKRVPPGYLVPAPRPATIAAGTSHFVPLRRRMVALHKSIVKPANCIRTQSEATQREW